MLFVFIALTIIGIFILVTDYRRESSRWVSAIAFSGAAGGLSVVMNVDIRSLFQPELVHIHRIIDYSRIILSIISNYGLPYTFIVFSIVNHKGSLSAVVKRWAKLLLLIPISITLIFYPWYPIHTQSSVFWAVPYIMFASYILLSSFIQEQNSIIKRDRFNSCLAIIPSMLCLMVNNFILDSIGIKGMYIYNPYAILFSVIVFVISILKHGFVGLRISIQTQKLDYTMKAITSGTIIMNHAIKNNIGKIKLYCENISHYARTTEQTELAKDIATIDETLNQINEMIYKIHDQTQEIILHRVRVKMNDLIEQVSSHYKLHNGNIELSNEYLTEVEVLCDNEHIQEVLNNLLLNSVEAMPMGGGLMIKLSETKRNVVIEITDTGCGINKEHLKRVFDPFFTTKLGSKNNFGLGLSYCYNVINKHGGRMEIHSVEGVGTTIYLNLLKYEEIK